MLGVLEEVIERDEVIEDVGLRVAVPEVVGDPDRVPELDPVIVVEGVCVGELPCVEDGVIEAVLEAVRDPVEVGDVLGVFDAVMD